MDLESRRDKKNFEKWGYFKMNAREKYVVFANKKIEEKLDHKNYEKKIQILKC